MRLKSQIQNKFIKNDRIYIIPSQTGFIFIGINFTLFLMSHIYANNFVLLITFILFLFFIIIMFETHHLMEKVRGVYPKIKDNYLDEFKVGFDSLDGRLQVELEDQKGNTVGEHRGKFNLKRARLSTRGDYGLFYVWSYRDLKQNLYLYPQRLKAKTSNQDKKFKHDLNAIEEFSHHRPHRLEESGRKINWKIFAKTQNLYSKSYEEVSPVGEIINFDDLEGSREERISKMSYLIWQANNIHQSYGIKIDGKKISQGTGIIHYRQCLELLSEA